MNMNSKSAKSVFTAVKLYTVLGNVTSNIDFNYQIIYYDITNSEQLEIDLWPRALPESAKQNIYVKSKRVSINKITSFLLKYIIILPSALYIFNQKLS